MKKFTIGIVGGTGYTGLELLRLLIPHPQVDIHTIVSRSEAGKSITEIFPGLEESLYFEQWDINKLKACDLVFFATPHQVAMNQARELVEAGVKVVDLSADFRLQNLGTFQKWYGCEHTDPKLLKEAVYGLSELNREKIQKARMIANPGCYPTSIQLPLAPLLQEGVIDYQGVFIDSKSGVSGAGRSLSLGNLYTENDENFKAYGVSGHRHLPEIEQELSRFTLKDQPMQVTFVPHLLPMTRGIESTIYCQLNTGFTLSDIYALWQQYFADEPFIRILENTVPTIKQVRGSNNVAFTAIIPQDRNILVISSVIDNLVKGASGQAVQNMNLMLGIPETMGLTQLPLLA